MAPLIALLLASALSQPLMTVSVTTTAYTHSEADHIKWGKSTAEGGKLRYEKDYTSAGSDWSSLPVGTEFIIPGIDRQYRIDDYGSALEGTNRVDLYFPTRRQMNRWGKRELDIVITKPGDWERSAKLLKGRKAPHCRRMLKRIEAKLQ